MTTLFPDNAATIASQESFPCPPRSLQRAPPARWHRSPSSALLFFIFGFVTWLNGPLIQFVELAFELNTVNAFLVLMVFYLSYFFLALPSSWLSAQHRHEERHGARPAGDGGRRGRCSASSSCGAGIPARSAACS